MQFQYNDGGRAKAGFFGTRTGDCVCRSIAIGTGLPYREVYDALNHIAQGERRGKRKRGISHARSGVYRGTYVKYLESLGWTWVPTMHIGSGCTVHLHDGELPMGTLIVSVSKHMTVVKDGVILDTFDPQRNINRIEPDNGRPLKAGEWRNENGICSVSRRCVYGYFIKK